MKETIVLLLTIFCLAQITYGQGFGFGFKAGLTLAQITGPSEQANGMDLEDNSNDGGFMIGAIVRYNITDLFGFKTELLYNQKGTKYNFTGNGYQYLPISGRNGTSVLITGEQSIDLNISNGYLNFPVMVFGKWKKLEFEGGVSVGLLLSSRASGEVRIDGRSSTGTPTGPYNGILDYKFNEAGSQPSGFTSADVTTLNIDGEMITFLDFLGAYHNFPPNGVLTLNSDRVFDSLDFGLVGGINYYWNSTLYLGARLNYGLTDVTNNNSGYDVSRSDINGGVRNDKDKNLSIQLSLGFSF